MYYHVTSEKFAEVTQQSVPIGIKYPKNVLRIA